MRAPFHWGESSPSGEKSIVGAVKFVFVGILKNKNFDLLFTKKHLLQIVAEFETNIFLVNKNSMYLLNKFEFRE